MNQDQAISTRQPLQPIFYFARIVPIYRRPVLERLNERLGGRLVVFAGKPPSSLASLTSDSKPGFPFVEVKNYWFRGESLHVQPFRRALSGFAKPAAVIVEESPRSVTQPMMLRRLRRMGVPRILWGHFRSTNRLFDLGSSRLDRYRLKTARSVEACICYSQGIRDMLAPHIPPERLFVARNTVDTDELTGIRRSLTFEGRSVVRQRLGLPVDKPIVAFIGRLVSNKKPELLIESYLELRKETGAALVVIGAGPAKADMLAMLTKELGANSSSGPLTNVFFQGALTNPQDFAPYLFASDVLLNPGRLGLSVNQAFALGVPIVSVCDPRFGLQADRQSSTDPPIHAPEAEYVLHDSTGMFAARPTPALIANQAQHVLDNHKRFSDAAADYADANLGLDTMVDGILDAIKFVLP